MDATSVQVAVDDLAGKLGHPVLIEDEQLLPLWWSVHDEFDGTRLRSILQRTCGPAASAMVSRLRLSKATTPMRTPEVPADDMRERWFAPIRDDEGFLGFLWVLDADGEISPAQTPAIEECAHVAAQVLRNVRRNADDRGRTRSVLLGRLTAAVDPDAAAALIELEGLDTQVSITVEAGTTIEGWLLGDGLTAHVRPTGRVATSGTPVPLAELSVAVHRAAATRRVLQAGGRLAAPTWNDLGAWLLVVAAPDAVTIAGVHPGAARLLNLPKPDLAETARVMLEAGGDVEAAARELFVHRTTLYYRLDRIRDLTGVDLRTGTGRVDLHMALRLAAYRRTIDNTTIIM